MLWKRFLFSSRLDRYKEVSVNEREKAHVVRVKIEKKRNVSNRTCQETRSARLRQYAGEI